jgi:hypothetical protein
MVPPVRVMLAGRTLLLDVRHLAIGRNFPVVAGHAATGQGRESKESNQTHHVKAPVARYFSSHQQILYRRAARFPRPATVLQQIRDSRDLRRFARRAPVGPNRAARHFYDAQTRRKVPV